MNFLRIWAISILLVNTFLVYRWVVAYANDPVAVETGLQACLEPPRSNCRSKIPGLELNRKVGWETSKTYNQKYLEGYFDRYCSGKNVLEIGHKGGLSSVNDPSKVLPVVPQAVGIDRDFPKYDGKTLPFPDSSQDCIFSSHMYEDMDPSDGIHVLKDWHRILRVGGFIVMTVPHQYLYEKRQSLPSRYNQDHKRLFTPAKLLEDFEKALPPNSYRVRLLRDRDDGYDYSIPPDQHPRLHGLYELELVVEKIEKPKWDLAP